MAAVVTSSAPNACPVTRRPTLSDTDRKIAQALADALIREVIAERAAAAPAPATTEAPPAVAGLDAEGRSGCATKWSVA